MLKKEIFKLRYVIFILVFQAIAFAVVTLIFFSKNDRQLSLSKVSNDEATTRSHRPKSVRLFVAILTHSMRRERRDAIRETWMQVCERYPSQVFCRFFTDAVGLDDMGKQALHVERRQSNDLVILNATGEIYISNFVIYDLKYIFFVACAYLFFLFFI